MRVTPRRPAGDEADRMASAFAAHAQRVARGAAPRNVRASCARVSRSTRQPQGSGAGNHGDHRGKPHGLESLL